ncbi:MAG: type II toxin-antitoxin system VapC family toxin [Deltaproteobacteria bacterium]|nr:type II toxin-antitoxin system VapC family toxin [Deltaproteobacteria bacterium]
MKLLLDTCTFLWLVSGDPRLSDNARTLFSDPDNAVFLSAVSAWEIVVKHALGKLSLSDDPADFVPRERARHFIEPLPIDEAASLALPRLPNHHRDPFDRLLVCQALTLGLTLLTPDPEIRRYPAQVLW